MLSPKQARRLASEVFADAPDDPSTGHDAPQPDRIGNCRIVRLIGSGGMGQVFQAEQDHPRRIVALKLLRAGLMSRSAARRFEFESEILGRLHDPGIAQVHAAGTYDDGAGGRPYFVMEYVPGALPITEFARQHKLSIDQRLELLVLVCDAVHHGHQKGIIHRDLKPDNILVPSLQPNPKPGQSEAPARVEQPVAHDPTALPHPKIIDFGIARATDADITLCTIQTDAGQLIGTLQYMSPEQCEGDASQIDIRTDIYSLGVVLYELLTDRVPYDLSHKSIPSATRIIQEQAPPPPSAFDRRLRGDLDAIITKSIAKPPTARYQSAAELAADIRAHLNGNPITARRPTRWSRAMRWVVRHPLITTGSACMLIALLTVIATRTLVWSIILRPDRIEITIDRQEARLRSYSDLVLHPWRADRNGQISFAALLPGRQTFDGQALAVLGYTSQSPKHSSEIIRAFPLDGDRDTAIWSRGVTADDCPEDFASVEKFAVDQGFHAQAGIVEDIFPESPGMEIVVVLQHSPSSPGVLRIYRSDGARLFQVWHDGGFSEPHWMPDAGLLVFTGLNSEVYWDQRGYPDAPTPHPFVIFAIRPQLGLISEEWTSPTPGMDQSALAWYRCLMPPEAAALLAEFEFIQPTPGTDPPGSIGLGARVATTRRGGICFFFDINGNELRDARRTDDAWKRNSTAADKEIFEFRDLPPIVEQ